MLHIYPLPFSKTCRPTTASTSIPHFKPCKRTCVFGTRLGQQPPNLTRSFPDARRSIIPPLLAGDNEISIASSSYPEKPAGGRLLPLPNIVLVIIFITRRFVIRQTARSPLRSRSVLTNAQCTFPGIAMLKITSSIVIVLWDALFNSHLPGRKSCLPTSAPDLAATCPC